MGKDWTGSIYAEEGRAAGVGGWGAQGALAARDVQCRGAVLS